MWSQQCAAVKTVFSVNKPPPQRWLDEWNMDTLKYAIKKFKYEVQYIKFTISDGHQIEICFKNRNYLPYKGILNQCSDILWL